MRAKCFRENGRFFDKIWAWEYCVFIENRRFLTNYGYKNSYFSVKNRKRRASYWLSGPKIYCSFDRIYVLLPNNGAKSFSRKIETKWHESTVFWEKQNMGLRALCFLNMGMTILRHFFLKIWKKGHLIDIFGR